MISPAKAHFMRVTAAQASALAATDDQAPENASAYELMLLKLAEDRRRLKGVHSMEAKAEIKRQILPDYQPWVDGVLQAGKGGQDAVITTVMLWMIDAGDFNGALRIAEYALPHKLAMLDHFQRPAGYTLAEEIADAAKRARDGKQPFDIAILQRCQALTQEEDMPDQVRAKLHKELGLLLEVSDPAAALANLTRAKALHDKVGVVKDIERIEKTIRNNTAPSG